MDLFNQVKEMIERKISEKAAKKFVDDNKDIWANTSTKLNLLFPGNEMVSGALDKGWVYSKTRI